MSEPGGTQRKPRSENNSWLSRAWASLLDLAGCEYRVLLGRQYKVSRKEAKGQVKAEVK